VLVLNILLCINGEAKKKKSCCEFRPEAEHLLSSRTHTQRERDITMLRSPAGGTLRRRKKRVCSKSLKQQKRHFKKLTANHFFFLLCSAVLRRIPCVPRQKACCSFIPFFVFCSVLFLNAPLGKKTEVDVKQCLRAFDGDKQEATF
jgi:hypothetical protein